MDAFEQDQLTLTDFILVQLFMATGRRPAQLADLQAQDLLEAKAADGSSTFLLQVPRRKQQGGVWRQEFKPFALQPELGKALKMLNMESWRRFGLLRPNATEVTSACLPIFVAWSVVAKESMKGADEGRAERCPDAYHCSTMHLRAQLNRIVDSLNVISERTGKRIHIFPTRLRRTLASRAAREGYGEMVIAELLDHSDTQNVKVYTENVPEAVNAIDAAVARQLAPLAQAFAGVLVKHESEAKRGSDPSSRLRGAQGAVGTCGHHGFCGAAAPIACYTCRHFQPWQDGVHGKVLESLRGERARLQEITQDPQIAAVNDRTILAVTQVVQLCEAQLKGAAGTATP